MSRALSFVLVLAIILVSLVVAHRLVSMRPEPERRERPSQVPFAVTEPVAAGDGAIPVLGAGTVQPHAEIDIAAEISGRVEWVNPAFQSGGRIAAEQTIFRIDDTEFRNRVEHARSDMATRQVELVRVEAQAHVASAEYEQFRRRRPDAAIAAEASPLTLWRPQLDAAQAALDRDKAVVAEAELALSRTLVRAPFDGIVRDESLAVGQFVAAGQTLGKLYASDAVEVVVPLPDASAALIPRLWNLRPGNTDQRVATQVVAEFGENRYSWDGYVDRAKTSVDERTRTIEVIVRVPNPFTAGSRLESVGPRPDTVGGNDFGRSKGPPLLVGKFVDVRIQGVAPAEYFRVRRPALRPGDKVWVVDGAQVKIVPVRVLQRTDGEVFVTGPLVEGQAVVVRGLQVATEGMSVRTRSGGGL